MDELVRRFQRATAPGEDRVLAGAVIASASSSGDTFIRAFGTTSINDNAESLVPSDIMWLASCTKLQTTVAALQCVERGLLTLEDDPSRILPNWNAPDVLVGFDETTDQPLFKKPDNPITLRMLLTHSSGLALEQSSPLLLRLKHRNGFTNASNVGSQGDIIDAIRTAFTQPSEAELPLVYEPGEGWSYGSSLDVVARMIEHVTGFGRLGNYMSENIWKPLGMSATTFRPATRPDLRVVPLTIRLPSQQLADGSNLPFPNKNPEQDSGGSGIFSSAEDYLKLLKSLLMNDGTLLRFETVESMFKPQLENDKPVNEAFHNPFLAQYLLPGVPNDRQWNWGFGGVIATNGIPGRGKEGTMSWSGISNPQWWIDPLGGTCGIFATQLLPPGDGGAAALYAEFQRTIYQQSAKL